jgi:hypothetical protein
MRFDFKIVPIPIEIACVGTKVISFSKKRELAFRVSDDKLTTEVVEVNEVPGSAKPICPLCPIPNIFLFLFSGFRLSFVVLCYFGVWV